MRPDDLKIEYEPAYDMHLLTMPLPEGLVDLVFDPEKLAASGLGWIWDSSELWGEAEPRWVNLEFGAKPTFFPPMCCTIGDGFSFDTAKNTVQIHLQAQHDPLDGTADEPFDRDTVWMRFAPIVRRILDLAKGA